MTSHPPVLHLVCGKIASGKSTLAEKLGTGTRTVTLAEDQWLAALFSDQLHAISDYARCSQKLETAIGPHVVALLRAGISVVLDFQANTVARRQWMRGLFEEAKAAHKLHYLDISDDVCIQRLQKRNSDGTHPFSPTPEQFRQFSKHFVPPSASEGFEIEIHRWQEP